MENDRTKKRANHLSTDHIKNNRKGDRKGVHSAVFIKLERGLEVSLKDPQVIIEKYPTKVSPHLPYKELLS